MHILLPLILCCATDEARRIAPGPTILITLGFKIFVLRKYANDFLYFKPTTEEQESVAGQANYSYKQRVRPLVLRATAGQDVFADHRTLSL